MAPKGGIDLEEFTAWYDMMKRKGEMPPWAAGIAAMHARRKRQSEARKQGRPAIAAAAAQNQGQVMSMRAR